MKYEEALNYLLEKGKDGYVICPDDYMYETCVLLKKDKKGNKYIETFGKFEDYIDEEWTPVLVGESFTEMIREVLINKKSSFLFNDYDIWVLPTSDGGCCLIGKEDLDYGDFSAEWIITTM